MPISSRNPRRSRSAITAVIQARNEVVLSRVVKMYEAWGKPEKAQEWSKR